jgi:cytoskeletal protein CcmA (bactofilin family)
MWKKENEGAGFDSPAPQRNPVDQLREKATIGASITVKGELSGGEDLLIHGQVEGKIDLKKHNVTVGRSGKVKADVYGKTISIEGDLQGNLFGEEKVIIRESGTVRGNITSPRVNLEDGSKFKGSIDMDSSDPKGQRPLVETRPEERLESAKGQTAPLRKDDKKQSQDVRLGARARSSSSNT